MWTQDQLGGDHCRRYNRFLPRTTCKARPQHTDPFSQPVLGRPSLFAPQDASTIVDAVAALDHLNNGKDDEVIFAFSCHTIKIYRASFLFNHTSLPHSTYRSFFLKAVTHVGYCKLALRHPSRAHQGSGCYCMVLSGRWISGCCWPPCSADRKANEETSGRAA